MRPGKSSTKPPKYDIVLLDGEGIDGSAPTRRIVKKVKPSNVGVQVLSPSMKFARSISTESTKTTWKYSLRGWHSYRMLKQCTASVVQNDALDD